MPWHFKLPWSARKPEQGRFEHFDDQKGAKRTRSWNWKWLQNQIKLSRPFLQGFARFRLRSKCTCCLGNSRCLTVDEKSSICHDYPLVCPCFFRHQVSFTFRSHFCRNCSFTRRYQHDLVLELFPHFGRWTKSDEQHLKRKVNDQNRKPKVLIWLVINISYFLTEPINYSFFHYRPFAYYTLEPMERPSRPIHLNVHMEFDPGMVWKGVLVCCMTSLCKWSIESLEAEDASSRCQLTRACLDWLGAVANYRHFVSNEQCSFERGEGRSLFVWKKNRHSWTAACGFARLPGRFGDEEIHNIRNFALVNAFMPKPEFVDVFCRADSRSSWSRAVASAVSDAQNEWQKVRSNPAQEEARERPFCRARDITGLP